MQGFYELVKTGHDKGENPAERLYSKDVVWPRPRLQTQANSSLMKPNVVSWQTLFIAAGCEEGCGGEMVG